MEAEEEGPCFRFYPGRTQRLMPPSPVPCFRLPGLTGERFASLLETKTYFLPFLQSIPSRNYFILLFTYARLSIPHRLLLHLPLFLGLPFP